MPPLQPASDPCAKSLEIAQRAADVPLWLPWPLPGDWRVTGYTYVGNEHTGTPACAVACSGPAPLGGHADMVLVAEEPGIGLGAYFADLAAPDPGRGFDAGVPHARVEALGHPLPLWSVDAGPERAVYVGEALACWLWIVLWPASAGVLMLEDLTLIDLREVGHDFELPYGELSPYLPS